METITVLVVTYNSEEDISGCLQSVGRELDSFQHEILIIDNASADQTVSTVRRLFPYAQILPSPENLGFSKAVNLGISKTSGNVILLLNPDVVLNDGCISELLRMLEADDSVAAVGPKHHYPNGRLQLTWGWAPTILREWLRKLCQYGLRSGDPKLTMRMENNTKKPLYVDWLAGSCILFRRQVDSVIGGWDESFFLFFEDIDWCVRARKAGYKVTFCPEALVQHREGASASTRPAESEAAYRKSQMTYAKKHWGFFSRIILWGGVLLRRR